MAGARPLKGFADKFSQAVLKVHASALGTKTTQQWKVVEDLFLRNTKYFAAADIICDSSFTVICGFEPLYFLRRTISYTRGDLSPYALLGRFLPRLRPSFGAASFCLRRSLSIVCWSPKSRSSHRLRGGPSWRIRGRLLRLQRKSQGSQARRLS